MKKALTIEHLLDDPETFKCLVLAGLGFSYKFIQKKTGLKNHQIYDRCKRIGLSCKLYRNGESMIAQHVEQQSTRFVEGTIRRQLTDEQHQQHQEPKTKY